MVAHQLQNHGEPPFQVNQVNFKLNLSQVQLLIVTWSQESHFKAKRGKKSCSKSQIQIFLLTRHSTVCESNIDWG